MNDNLLLGIGHHLLPIPRPVWRRQVAANAERSRAALGFMTCDHHRVRDLAVLGLPRNGEPLPPEMFAEVLSLPLVRVKAILDELEKRKTFLFRDESGAVAWAYPVTVESTPHRITFSTGERLYAA